ncbi:hypothetical protein ABVG11_02320 [Streptomyces sp. HD1123-B1]|uniref:hypothetical protein n=1 Tax=Streptomyces huangiella TaxID=3228804 RepID=UPI003D7C8330
MSAPIPPVGITTAWQTAGIPANASAAASTIYTILKDIGARTDFSMTSGTPIDAVPPAYKDAHVEYLTRQHLYGVWYTHSIIYPVARKLSLTHRHTQQGAEAEKALMKGKSVSSIVPYVFSYTPARVSVRTQDLQALAEADKLRNEARGINPEYCRKAIASNRAEAEKSRAEAENLARDLERRADGLRPFQKRDLQERIAALEYRVSEFTQESQEANDALTRRDYLLKEAERLRNRAYSKEADSLVFPTNFRVDLIEQVGTMKMRQSQGVKAEGSMAISPVFGRQDSSLVSVHFNWSEHILAHTWAWHGTLNIAADQSSGAPVVLGGEGKFFERFQQFAR